MGVNDAREQLEVAKAEVARLEAAYENLARLHEVATERTVQLAAVIERAPVLLASHRATEFVELDGDEWSWQCECGESFGHLNEGAPVPAGSSAVAWRLTEHHGRVLATAYTDAALREVRAKAWDEGYETGSEDEMFNQRGSWADPDKDEFPHRNPYRQEGGNG